MITPRLLILLLFPLLLHSALAAVSDDVALKCYLSGQVATSLGAFQNGRIIAKIRVQLNDLGLMASIIISHHNKTAADLRIFPNRVVTTILDPLGVLRTHYLDMNTTQSDHIYIFEKTPSFFRAYVGNTLIQSVDLTLDNVTLDLVHMYLVFNLYSPSFEPEVEHDGAAQVKYVEYDRYDNATRGFVPEWHDTFASLNASRWKVSNGLTSDLNRAVYVSQNAFVANHTLVLLFTSNLGCNYSENFQSFPTGGHDILTTIIPSVVCAVLVIGIGVLVFVYIKRKKKRYKTQELFTVKTEFKQGNEVIPHPDFQKTSGTPPPKALSKSQGSQGSPGCSKSDERGPLTNSDLVKVGYTSTISGSNCSDLARSDQASELRARTDLLFNGDWKCSGKDIVKGDFIGEGSEGIVHKATYNGTTVALKQMRKKQLTFREIEDFCRQVNFMHQMTKHPNVVSFIAACIDPMCILMELAVGKQLYCIHNCSLNIKGRKLDILIQIAQGVHHIHSNGLVHNDLWTKNIVISEEGVAKIIDFGLSRLSETKTRTRGHRNYWDPFSGPEVSSSRDIFSFGVIMWEVLCQRRPDKQPHEQDFIPLSELDGLPILRDIIGECCNPDLKKRPQTLGVVYDRLKALQEDPLYNSL